MTTRKQISLRHLAPTSQPRDPSAQQVLDWWRQAIAQAKGGDPSKLL